jgi:vancomycin resistance protein YoaR
VEQTWTISPAKLATWVNVERVGSGDIHFGLHRDSVMEWLRTTVEPDVTVDSHNARFQIDSKGKVIEFQGSRIGQALDSESTWQALDAAMHARVVDESGAPKFIQAVVVHVTPDVSTGEVNNLGITDILGVGVSRFTGSPANRIINIKNGVAKINGLLIKPGEEFSTVKYTQPYTTEGGYVPELSIQGNKVEPAMGGGLCQISTTLFRMAMNSGLDITERRNHSLLVAYYNDLVNGMPGTDATIFEPSPDFKFRNDTGNYVLIQAEVDTKKSELRFTLWGTSDGRKAEYTHPIVKRWIPYSTTPRITETTTLPPGQKKCQHAYQGAEASFTYTRTLASGEVQEKVFNSYYRPLPEICLVGAATSTPQEVSTTNTPVVDGGTPVVVPE